MIVQSGSIARCQESLQINIKIKPRIGNTCVTKATISNEIVAIIVALGCIFENTHATPILLTITSILTSLPKINNKALLLMTSSLISSTYAKDVLTLLSQSLVCLNIAVFISF